MDRPACRFGEQKGAALLAYFLVILLGLGFFVVSPLMPKLASMRDSNTTTASLVQAREALIAYAASRIKQPGALPCPDNNNDGQSDASGSNCAVYLGRLPWRTLGIGPLRDGAGECLWYALSQDFRSTLAASNRSVTPQLNPSLPGQLVVVNSAGSPLPSPVNPVIAIVFSPGAALATQDRTPDGNSVCGGNLNIGNYLDTAATINNASGGNILIAADGSSTFNDRLEWITSEQLFTATNSRVLNTLRGSIPDSKGVAYYFEQLGNYPFAATATSDGHAVPNTQTGLVPYADLNYIGPLDTDTNTWLTANGWYQRVSYTVSPGQDRVILAIGSQSRSCGNGSNACP